MKQWVAGVGAWHCQTGIVTCGVGIGCAAAAAKFCGWRAWQRTVGQLKNVQSPLGWVMHCSRIWVQTVAGVGGQPKNVQSPLG